VRRAGRIYGGSVYARSATGTATTHPLASEPSTYVAVGDHTADRGGGAFGDAQANWPFLNGIDVVAPGRTGAVVAFGDSITDGFPSTAGRAAGARDTRWSDFLARRLLRAGRPLSVVNQGSAATASAWTRWRRSPRSTGPAVYLAWTAMRSASRA
jgi:hypothetical protein